jgi:hypothetical protein
LIYVPLYGTSSCLCKGTGSSQSNEDGDNKNTGFHKISLND